MFLFTSCGTVREAAGTIGELQQVRQALSTKLNTSDVGVNLSNGQYLTISLVNSPLKALPSDEKKTKAHELAELGYRSYSQASSLTQVTVVFVVQRSYLGVLNYTDSNDAFAFPAAELSPAKAP